jgi:hypothetical protein
MRFSTQIYTIIVVLPHGCSLRVARMPEDSQCVPESKSVFGISLSCYKAKVPCQLLGEEACHICSSNVQPSGLVAHCGNRYVQPPVGGCTPFTVVGKEPTWLDIAAAGVASLLNSWWGNVSLVAQ